MPQPKVSRFNPGPSVWAALAIAAALMLPNGAQAADPPTCKLQALVELPVTMVGTRPTITVKINGKEGRFLVDSGASYSVITRVAATAFGLQLEASPVQMQGIGGGADTQMATVKQFVLGGFQIPYIDFLVLPIGDDNVAGILGENILGGPDIEYDLANGVVRIFKTEHCGSSDLAYWSKVPANRLSMLADPSPNNRHVMAYGSVNGHRITVTFDTGAFRSVLTLRAASSAGVTSQTLGAVYAGKTNGIGSRRVDTWIAPFDSFKLDGEEIKHTRLRIGGIELTGSDMLLGADFFLSHRIYVSNNQRKIYFTYNGGQVFQLEATPQGATPVTDKLPSKPVDSATPSVTAETPPANMNLPTDAAGFQRRGAAFMGRRDFVHAIEDFTHAAELEPANPQPLYDRGLARMDNRQPILAMSDFDQALRLKPDDVRTLMARAVLYNASGDKVHAHADLDAANRIGPTDPMVALTLADDYQRFGFHDEAIAGYDRWIAANPKLDQATVINHRCQTRADTKTDLDKALADCNAALRLDPHEVNALRSRGLVHFMRGEFDPAIADFDAIVRLQPKAPIALYGRGAAKLKKGLTAEGDADIAAATALAPKIADQAKRLGLTL